jgi:hypothetical protein
MCLVLFTDNKTRSLTAVIMFTFLISISKTWDTLVKTSNKCHKMSHCEYIAFKSDNLITYKFRFPLYTECSAGERTAISWTDRVKNEVLDRVKEEGNILHTIARSEANWIGHMSIYWMLEGTSKRGRKRKHSMTLRKRQVTRNWKNSLWNRLRTYNRTG